jgi:DNA-binding HxlR family transcriptional regulator
VAVPAELARAIHHVRSSPMFAVLEVLGDPWLLRIVDALGAGAGRFDALARRLALPRSTLTARLRLLQDRGCVIAIRYSDSPPRDEYRLTAMGRDALGAITLLHQWNRRWAPRRGRVDAAAPCRHCAATAGIAAACATCGVDVVPRDVAALDFPLAAPPPLPPVPGYRRSRRGGERTGAAATAPTGEECVGDRWISLVLGAALLGVRRFRDFQAALDIAPNILAARLDALVASGLVARAPAAPARPEYRITAKGLDLYPAILALHAWGERWLDPGWAARSGWALLHRPCATWLATQLVCTSCRAATEQPKV